MRVTFGQFRRRFVYNIKVGDKQVKRVMWRGKQIWPSDEDRVRTLALDMSSERSSDMAYWIHALDATAAMSNASCHLTVTIAGRKYCVNTGYGGLPVVKYELGVLDFGSDGPPLQDVRIGEELDFQAVIPARELKVVETPSQNAEVSGIVDVPWLPATGLRVKVKKGQKKKSAGVRFSVTGQPSGTVHIGGFAQKNGHSRGSYYGTAYARDMGVINGRVSAYHDECVNGDVRLNVWGDWYNSGKGYLSLLFPGFSKTLRFKVSAVSV